MYFGFQKVRQCKFQYYSALDDFVKYHYTNKYQNRNSLRVTAMLFIPTS